MNQLHFLRIRRQLMTDSNAITRPWQPMTCSSMWGDADPTCFQTHRAGTRELHDCGDFGSWSWKSPQSSQAVRAAMDPSPQEPTNRPRGEELQNSATLFVPMYPPTFINMLHENILRKQLSQFVLPSSCIIGFQSFDWRHLSIAYFHQFLHLEACWPQINWHALMGSLLRTAQAATIIARNVKGHLARCWENLRNTEVWRARFSEMNAEWRFLWIFQTRCKLLRKFLKLDTCLVSGSWWLPCKFVCMSTGTSASTFRHPVLGKPELQSRFAAALRSELLEHPFEKTPSLRLSCC